MNTSRCRQLARRIIENSATKYGVASLVPRVTSILGLFVITPFALREFGAVAFGYWTLATFVSGLVISPDLGIGNSVVNEFTSSRLKGDVLADHASRMRGLVALLSVVAASWLLIGVAVSLVYSIFIVDDEFGTQTLLALSLGLFCFLSAVPVVVVQKVQLSYEVANEAVLWEGLGKITAVGLSLLVIFYAPNVFLLVVAYMLPVTITAWLNGVRFMHRNNVKLFVGKPTLHGIFERNRATVAAGKWFVIIQVSYLFLTSADVYVVNGILGPESVSHVSVIKRPFDVLPVIVSMYAVALWPIFRRLIVNGEVFKVQRLVTSIVTVTVCGSVFGALVLIFISPSLYEVLSSGVISPESGLLYSVGALSVMTGTVMIFTSLLNAIPALKAQALVFGCGSLVSAGAKVWGLKHGGVSGFFIFSAISYFVCIFAPLALLSMHHLRKLSLSADQGVVTTSGLSGGGRS